MPKKRIGTYVGAGAVFSDERKIATVNYALAEFQNIIRTRTLGGTDEIPGLTDVQGTITVQDGETNLLEMDDLVLETEDGKRMAFVVSRRRMFGSAGPVFEVLRSGDWLS